jgi:hypothetical protein
VRVAASMCPWWPGREDGVAVDDALRLEPWTWSMVVTEHTPPPRWINCVHHQEVYRARGWRG